MWLVPGAHWQGAATKTPEFDGRPLDLTNAHDYLRSRVTFRPFRDDDPKWFALASAAAGHEPVIRDPLLSIGEITERPYEGEVTTVLSSHGVRLGDKLVTDRVATALDNLAAFWNTQMPLVAEGYGALMDDVKAALAQADEGRPPGSFSEPVQKLIEYQRNQTAMRRRHDAEIEALRATDPRNFIKRAKVTDSSPNN